LKEWKPEDRPHLLGLIYYSFRVMVAIGFFFAGLMLWTVLQWVRGKLSDGEIDGQRWLMRAWIFAAPLGYIAVEAGWIVRCVGRQPWTLYGQIRTADAASSLPPENVLVSLCGFAIVYSLLFLCALYFGSRIIRKGPDLNIPVPIFDRATSLPVKHSPDRRPLET
jgi:cytochrome d ubiquinol oxidase subunit I